VIAATAVVERPDPSVDVSQMSVLPTFERLRLTTECLAASMTQPTTWTPCSGARVEVSGAGRVSAMKDVE